MTILTRIDPATAEPKAKALLDGIHKKLGVTPNMMKVLANNPTVLGAYLGFAGALSGAGLGSKLHEQIALMVAETNGCNYCLAAHTLLGQNVGLTAIDILAARSGTRLTPAMAPFSPLHASSWPDMAASPPPTLRKRGPLRSPTRISSRS